MMKVTATAKPSLTRQTLLRGYLDPNAAVPLLDATALADDEEVF